MGYTCWFFTEDDAVVYEKTVKKFCFIYLFCTKGIFKKEFLDIRLKKHFFLGPQSNFLPDSVYKFFENIHVITKQTNKQTNQHTLSFRG